MCINVQQDKLAHTVSTLVLPVCMAMNVEVYVSQVALIAHVTMFMVVWKVTPKPSGNIASYRIFKSDTDVID